MRPHLLPLVAVLALAIAACGGDSDEPAARTGGPGATLDLSAKGIAFDKKQLSAAAGPVSIRFDNQDGGIPHNLHLTGDGVDEKTEIKEGPTTQTLAVDLEPGTYSYACDVHPQQMIGELAVS